jgi:hypothetical protein
MQLIALVFLSTFGFNGDAERAQFVTQNGLSEFVYYMQKYNNGYNFNGNDDANNDDANQGYNDFDDLPLCEQSNGNYVGLGCNDDGTFAIMYFSDKYCLKTTGDVYDKLRSLNRQLRTYKSCATIYKGGSSDNGYTLPSVLVQNSDSCSSLETSLCTDSSSMKSRRSHTSRSSSGSRTGALSMQSLSQKSWVTKLKYVTAGILLLASFVMFTGILFTNRRRRRALMQRKYRQSKSRKSKSRSGRSSRSKSKSRDGRASTKSPSRKSSKAPKSRDDDDDDDDGNGGVFS